MTAATQTKRLASWRKEHSTGKKLNLSQLYKCTPTCPTANKKENILCIFTGLVQFFRHILFSLYSSDKYTKMVVVGKRLYEQMDEVTTTLLETDAEL